MIRQLMGAMSPAGPRGRLSILVFHRVVAKPDPLFPDEVDVARFHTVCRWLKDWFQVLPLDEAAGMLREGRLPARAAAITFDDGYLDNHDEALPILQRHRLNATFFIACGFLDGGRMWNDTIIESVRRCGRRELDLRGLAEEFGTDSDGHAARAEAWSKPLPLGDVQRQRDAVATIIGHTKYLRHGDRLRMAAAVAQRSGARLPDDLMMSSDQVLALHRAGMVIGAHTMTHPILAQMDDDGVRAEMRGSRDVLQALTGKPVPLFAYPNGRRGTDWNDRTAALAAEVGFEASVTCDWGAARQGHAMQALPRFTPWDRTRTRYGLRMVRNLWA